jgi:autotransporter family porin
VVDGVLSWNGVKDGKAGHGASLAIGDADNVGDLTTASVASAYVDNLSIAQGSRLVWRKDADWHVLTTGADAISNAGTLTLSDVNNAAATLTGNLVNSGSLVLNPTAHTAGNTLTVDGNYTGVAGSVVSLDGIQVVKVGGRVVAGAYDYTLQKGNATETDDKDWYLTSYLTPVDPVDPVNPVNPVRMVRPETGACAANLQASRSLFNLSLHDRGGETRYADPVTGETGTTILWMRNEGGRNTARLAGGQNKTSANRYVLQLGGDVAARESDAAGRLSLGVMGGYANQHSTTRNGLGASAETGYNWRLISWLSRSGTDNSFWLQPHAQVIWSGVKADDHTEANGTRVQGTGSDGVQTKLGLRAYMNGKSAQNKCTARSHT